LPDDPKDRNEDPFLRKTAPSTLDGVAELRIADEEDGTEPGAAEPISGATGAPEAVRLARLNMPRNDVDAGPFPGETGVGPVRLDTVFPGVSPPVDAPDACGWDSNDGAAGGAGGW
jgi:hypothetical protein